MKTRLALRILFGLVQYLHVVVCAPAAPELPAPLAAAPASLPTPKARSSTSGSTPTAPRITEQPRDILATGGGDVGRLNCRASGYPLPAITWLKDGKPLKESIVKNIVSMPEGGLIFLEVLGRGSDGANVGSYQCIATNPLGKVYSRNASVQLAYLRDEFRVTPADTIGIRGRQVTLRCQAPRGVPEATISWQKGTKPIKSSNRIQITKGNLVIRRAQKSDSGSYVCVAKNIAGVKRSTSAILKINELPKIVVAPSNRDVNTGISVKLTCEAEGDPQPVITWTKNGAELLDERHIILYNGVLQILKAKRSDQGEYVCTATNTAGSVSARAFVSVKGLPEFTETSSDATFAIGQTATLSCRAKGNPPPTVFWRDPAGLELFSRSNDDGAKMHVTSDGDLVIRDVHFKEDGTYKCQAINPIGTVVKDVRLRIIPRVSSMPPPVIDAVPQNVSVATGSSVTLRCTSVTSPKPVITWYKNGYQLQSASAPSPESGNLQIGNAQATDDARYTCKAVNDYGISSWAARVRVQPRGSIVSSLPKVPVAPERPQVVNSTSSSITIGWRSGENSKNSVTSYVVEYYRIGSQEPSWRRISDVLGRVLVVGNLTASSDYVFLVRAVSSGAVSNASPTSNTMRTGDLEIPETPEEAQAKLNRVDVQLAHAIPLKNPGQRTGSVRLRWTTEGACADLSSFVIAWQAVSGPDKAIKSDSVPCASRSYDLTDARSGVRYEVRIRPIKGSLKGRATPIVFVSLDGEEITPQRPAIYLQRIDDDDSAVMVNWATPSDIADDRITGFTVRWRSSDGKYREAVNLNGSETGIVLRHLAGDKKFLISVTYYTLLGEGETSPETAIDLGAPTTETPEGGFVEMIQKQPAILVGLAVGLIALVAITIVGVCYYRKTRRNRKARGLHVRSFSFTPQSGPHRISGAARFDGSSPFPAAFHMTPTVGGASGGSVDSGDGGCCGGKGAGLAGPGSADNSRMFIQRPSDGMGQTPKGHQSTVVSYDAKSGTVSNSLDEKPMGIAHPSFSYVADQLTRVSDIPPQFSSTNLSRPSVASTQSGHIQHQMQQHHSQLLHNRSGSSNVFSTPDQDLGYPDVSSSPQSKLPPPPPSPPLSQRTGFSDRTERSRGSSVAMHSTGSGRSQRSRRRAAPANGTGSSGAAAPTCQYTSIDTDTGIDSPHQTPSPHRPIDMRSMPSPGPPTPPMRVASVFPYGRGQPVMQFDESRDPTLNLGYLAGPSEGDTDGENDTVGQLRVGQFVNDAQRNSVAVSSVSMMNTYDSETDEREDTSSGRNSPGCESSDDESLQMESVSQVGQNRLEDDEIELIRPNPQPRTFQPKTHTHHHHHHNQHHKEASPTRRQYPHTYHRHPEEDEGLPLLNGSQGELQPATKPRPSRKTNSKGKRPGNKKSSLASSSSSGNINNNNNNSSVGGNIALMQSGSSSTSSSYHHNTGDSGMSAGVGCSTEHSSLNSNASAGSGGLSRDGLPLSRQTGTAAAVSAVDGGREADYSSAVSPTTSGVSEHSGYHSTGSSCWQYHEAPYSPSKKANPQIPRRVARQDTQPVPVLHQRPNNFPEGKNLHYSKSDQALHLRSPDRTPVLSDFNVTPTNGPFLPGADGATQFQLARTVFGAGSGVHGKIARGLPQELSDVPEVSTSDFCEDYSDQSQ